VSFPEWLALGLTVLLAAALCSLAVACVLTIGWVGWMLANEGRAADYRRRIDHALHCHAEGKNPWLHAVHSEAGYATRYAGERLVRRMHGSSPPPT
jgi:hypothetical protein